jgi:hypothetical protein
VDIADAIPVALGDPNARLFGVWIVALPWLGNGEEAGPAARSGAVIVSCWQGGRKSIRLPVSANA